jgi:hypothetical protein
MCCVHSSDLKYLHLTPCSKILCSLTALAGSQLNYERVEVDPLDVPRFFSASTGILIYIYVYVYLIYVHVYVYMYIYIYCVGSDFVIPLVVIFSTSLSSSTQIS